jgi:long-chain acyl-CoA synthetase
MSLAAVLMDHPAADGDDLLFTIDRTVTAGDARREARRIAGSLTRIGIGPGQAVAVNLADGPSAVCTMIGVWLAGAVYIPLNPRAPEAERRRTVESTGAAALVDDDGPRRLPGDRRYDPTVAVVLWTSGTTGPPKPIVHTHAAYVALVDRVLDALRPAGRQRPPSPNLIPTSLALNAGFYNALFGLRSGASLVLMDRFDPVTFAALVHRHAVRSTVLPPAAMVALVDSADVTDLAPLRYVRSITAPLSPLQGRRFADKFGVTVLNSYGQAELGEVVGWTVADAREHPEKLGAAGRPHPGVQVKIVDDDGRTAPSGTVGRLLVRSDEASDDLGDRVDGDGYVDTGDLARMDDDGFVWIEGRAGDVINRGGNKIFPDQVEEVLCLSPAVDDAAVVAVADERLGEVPVALVVAHPGRVPDAAALERLCREHLAPYKVPVTFTVVDELARNDAGKLRRQELSRRSLPTRPA